MCERCNQAEFGAAMSLEKWQQAEDEKQALAAELAEARLRLARVANLAAATDVLEFHRLRSAIDDMGKVARGGLPAEGGV